jgi:hypothetical protein
MEPKISFFIVFHSFLLRMRNVSDKGYTDNQNTNFMFNTFSENRAVFRIKWGKKTVEPDRRQMTILRMRIACWMITATDTHSE